LVTGVEMERKEFEQLVIRALEELPELFKEKLENVDVVIEDKPTREQARAMDPGQGGLILGLYQGVPLVKRCHYYGMVMPDKISIFQKNIEKACRAEEDIVAMVSHTVQHELAHHLGISDERLREEGIY